jgi:hypothetical protein
MRCDARGLRYGSGKICYQFKIKTESAYPGVIVRRDRGVGYLYEGGMVAPQVARHKTS